MSDVSLRETNLVLYVFSGPHLGAQIALPFGTWLLGSDDSSDLILSGLAPSHAELEIRPGDPPSVTVRSKNGSVTFHDQTVENEISPEAGEPWYLGETLFVWNVPGVQQEQIVPSFSAPSGAGGRDETDEAADEDEKTTTQAENTEQAEETTSEAQNESSESDAPASESQKTSPETPPETTQSSADEKGGNDPLSMAAPNPPRPLWKRVARPLPLALLAFLFCALSFPLTSFDGPDPEAVRAILKELSISSLDVRVEHAGVLIEGAVAKEAERTKIEEAVEKLSFPVYLDVVIDEDIIRAVSNSLGSQGFFPVVRMVHGDTSSHLDIACFMRDSLVEQTAFFRLDHDVPPPPKKERRIVYAYDVEKILRLELDNAGLSDVSVVFLPGRVTFTGNSIESRKSILDRIRSSLSRRFGVPLFGETLSTVLPASKSSSLSVQNKKTIGGEAENVSQGPIRGDLGGLVITGVFVAPMSFITTEDGRYLFQGSVLPNGDQLVRISTKKLLLRRGDTEYTYQLRGSQ